MNKITTALLGLLTLLCVSCRSTKQEQSNDSGYDFIASLFHPSETDTTSIFYVLKNPDGTVIALLLFRRAAGYTQECKEPKQGSRNLIHATKLRKTPWFTRSSFLSPPIDSATRKLA